MADVFTQPWARTNSASSKKGMVALKRLIGAAVAALTLIGCQSPLGSELLGDWQGWIATDGLPFQDLAQHGNKWTLTLRGDGTYEEHLVNNVMMNLKCDTQGTYKRTGETLVLTGMMSYHMDDGYGKPDVGVRPVRDRAVLSKGALWRYRGGQYYGVFMRTDQKPTGLKKPTEPPLMPALPSSDPAAIEVLKGVQNRYRTLRSYADEGVVKSAGYGSTAKEVRFRTRFLAPSKFMFEAALLDQGKVFERHAAWSNGSYSEHRWTEKDSVAKADAGLTQALRARSDLNGGSSLVVTRLLLPKLYPQYLLPKMAKSVVLKKDDEHDGNPCWVLLLRNAEEEGLLLWVDKNDQVILRAYDEWSRVDIRFEPRLNEPISAKELLPGF